MKCANLEKAKGEALRFLEKVKELEQADTGGLALCTYVWGGKHIGAVKRASMDLTRALAELRKPD
jgi:hypothetical protein